MLDQGFQKLREGAYAWVATGAAPSFCEPSK